jgi:branched-chain amino acid aminotransferase
MSERLVYLSGELVPESEARISIFDTAFSLGFTVTESTRTFAHQPFKLERHIDRLFKSLKIARIDIGISPDQLTSETMDLLGRNQQLCQPHEDYWIVHNVSSGVHKLGPDPTTRNSGPTVIIFNAPMDLTGWARYYSEGCHAVTPMSRQIPSQSMDARIKNRSRFFSMLMEHEVKLVDPDAQSVWLDTDGYVSENKGGNVFIVAEGVLKTPTSENCLAGITRETTLEIAASLEIPCLETRLQPYDLYTADELFFTSTPYCIMPASRFNGLPVGDGQVGPLTRQLLEGWSDLVGIDVVKQASDQVE